MSLRQVARFREMFKRPNEYPSIREMIADVPQNEENKIVDYLNSGEMLAGCLGLERDVLDPSKGEFLECHALTDGEWEWRADLAYYVRQYHFRLPLEFVEHMKSNSWKVLPVEEMDDSIFD